MSQPKAQSISLALSSKRIILWWATIFCRELLLFKKNYFINYGKQLMKTPMFRAINGTLKQIQSYNYHLIEFLSTSS